MSDPDTPDPDALPSVDVLEQMLTSLDSDYQNAREIDSFGQTGYADEPTFTDGLAWLELCIEAKKID